MMMNIIIDHQLPGIIDQIVNDNLNPQQVSVQNCRQEADDDDDDDVDDAYEDDDDEMDDYDVMMTMMMMVTMMTKKINIRSFYIVM